MSEATNYPFFTNSHIFPVKSENRLQTYRPDGYKHLPPSDRCSNLLVQVTGKPRCQGIPLYFPRQSCEDYLYLGSRNAWQIFISLTAVTIIAIPASLGRLVNLFKMCLCMRTHPIWKVLCLAWKVGFWTDKIFFVHTRFRNGRFPWSSLFPVILNNTSSFTVNSRQGSWFE